MGSLVAPTVSPVREDPLTLIWQMILRCHLRIFLPLNTSMLGIVNLWRLHFVGTALFFVCWDTVWNTTVRETVNVGSSDCDYLWICVIHTSSDPIDWFVSWGTALSAGGGLQTGEFIVLGITIWSSSWGLSSWDIGFRGYTGLTLPWGWGKCLGWSADWGIHSIGVTIWSSSWGLSSGDVGWVLYWLCPNGELTL